MGKRTTEQVRLPKALMKDIRAVAPVLGEAPHDYVARVVREALKRDTPKAAKILARKAAGQGEEGGAE